MQNKPMTKLLSAASIVVMLLGIASQSVGQPAQGANQRRDRAPHLPADAAVNVWLGMDVLQYWRATESNAAIFSRSASWEQNADIAGAWSTAEIPGLVLTLLQDGNFSLATTTNPDAGCAAGVERGNWAVMEGTGLLRFHIKTDTNGHCGFSDPNAPMTIRKMDATLLLISNEPPAGNHEVPLVRR